MLLTAMWLQPQSTSFSFFNSRWTKSRQICVLLEQKRQMSYDAYCNEPRISSLDKNERMLGPTTRIKVSRDGGVGAAIMNITIECCVPTYVLLLLYKH